MTELQFLNEFTYKDILRGVDSKNKERAKERSAHYQGLFDNELRFTSQGTGKWIQKVRLLDLSDALQLKGMTLLDRVRLAVSGDIEVTCSCPAWNWWGYKYIATELGFNFKEDPETRFPKIRNKNLSGVICKHLTTVLQVLTFNSGKIVGDIKRSPKYKKYVAVQESFKNEYFPLNEEAVLKYENLGGKFKYLSLDRLISNFISPVSKQQEEIVTKDNLVVVFESTSGKYLCVKGSNVLKESEGKYSKVPVIILG